MQLWFIYRTFKAKSTRFLCDAKSDCFKKQLFYSKQNHEPNQVGLILYFESVNGL